MKTCAQYIAEAKKLLGDPKMSDRVLGESLGGYTQPTIHKAKTGNMPDSIAIKVAHICGVPAGEVLMVARLEREKDPEVKAHLEAWAGKIFGLLPQEGAALPALVAGPDVPMLHAIESASARQKPKSPTDFRLPGSSGGEGGIRTHGTGIPYA
jgi:hypothetical protein